MIVASGAFQYVIGHFLIIAARVSFVQYNSSSLSTFENVIRFYFIGDQIMVIMGVKIKLEIQVWDLIIFENFGSSK